MLRGETKVEIVPPAPRARRMKTKNSLSVAAGDDGLFTALRTLRKQVADESGVPPYVIFHDSSLREMAARQPTLLAEFAEIPGVGHRKLNRYGERFLDVIRVHARPS